MVEFVRDVTAAQKKTMAPGAGRRGALVGLYLAALVAGYALGVRGLFPFHPFPKPTSSPLSRVGLALASDRLELGAAGWEGLRRDVQAARAAENPETRGVLDLVAAVRGLETSGEPAWEEAETRCRALRWSRCDRPSLRLLAQRSRP
jgi:hypothetical protein